MKKLNNIIPEFDKLAPIFFLMLLNLVAYANYGMYQSADNPNAYDFFVLISSYVYFYISLTPQIKIHSLIIFTLLLSFVTVLINDIYVFNIISVIIMVLYFKDKQNIVRTIFLIVFSVAIQFLLNWIYFSFIGNSYVIFTFIYFPFSFLIYKIGGTTNVGRH